VNQVRPVPERPASSGLLFFGEWLSDPIQHLTQERTAMTTTKIEQIRSLNDRLRQNLDIGAETVVITTGVAALGDESVARIFRTIVVYDDFSHENDPYEEHDFGAFEAEGRVIFFKIDYYDPTLTSHSSDPADPNITQRVIMIMLAEEY
jgi:hypothetical protein